MARSLRYDRPGAWHHVMHRGARREPIFRRDDHCLLFLRCLTEAVEHHGLEVHAFSLMPNHYHLLVRTPLGNLSRCMRHLNATYTQRVNRLHGWDGPVFRGRFHSQLIEDEAHLDQVFTYIHLNPFRAGLAARLDDPCWTSLRAYLGKERRPTWLETAFFTERFGGPSGIAEAIRARRQHRSEWPAYQDPETGWIRLPAVERTGRAAKWAKEVERPVRGAKIRDVLADIAEIAGCTVADLQRSVMGPRANPARRFAAWALSRARFPHREIARALRMSEGQVAKVLWRFRRGKLPAPLPDWMAAFVAQVESGRS